MTLGGISIRDHQPHYEKFIHSLAEKYAEEQMSDQQDREVETQQSKKERLMLEYEQQLDVPQYTMQLDRAFTLLSTHGVRTFSAEQLQGYNEDLDRASKTLENFHFESLPDTSIAEFLGIQANTLAAIQNLAIDVFDSSPEDSLSLYTLLANLDNHNPENWYELGTVLQDLKKYDKAILAYNDCLKYNPSHLKCLVFLCECYISTEQFNSAAQTAGTIKSLIQLNSSQDELQINADIIEHFKSLESHINHGLNP